MEDGAKDVTRARAMYEAPAADGHVDACRELAKLLEKGRGGPADRERARELYERAAELGADLYSRRRLVKAFGLEWYAPGRDG
jgi:TPR repeat protein